MAVRERGRTLTIGAEQVPYTVVRTDRRTLAVQIAADGSVCVRAPLFAREADIAAFVTGHRAWIGRHRERIRSRQAPRVHTYADGDTITYLGRVYALRIERGARAAVRFEGAEVIVTVRGEPTPERVKRALDAWVRDHARELFNARLERCWERFAAPRERMPTVRVKAMRTRWGSLSAEGMMSLNVRLLAAESRQIDYVIFHELCHLRVRGHGPDFYRELEKMVPEWRAARNGLRGIGFP